MSNEINFGFSLSESELEFRVESFQVQEQLSQPFQVIVTLLCEDADLDLESLLTQSGCLSLLGQGSGVSRCFHGVVQQARFIGTAKRFSRYECVLSPQIAFLAHRSNCRIFQTLSAEEIIQQVFDDAGISDVEWKTIHNYPQLEYTLQYRETDLEFVHRMLAQHGLWYYFEHSESGHHMVITDSNTTVETLQSDMENSSDNSSEILYHPVGGGVPDREHIFEIGAAIRAQFAQVALADYNYLTPKLPLDVESSLTGQEQARLYDYTGRYGDPEQGVLQAEHRQQRHLVEQRNIGGRSCVMRLTPGYHIDVQGHPRSAINRDFLLLSVTHVGDNPQVQEEGATGEPTTYGNTITLLDADIEFKPAYHQPVRIDGPQTGVVVGPEGEEIYTDELGRVKVRFHWDRAETEDENATCWIRVSQSMAGGNWGSVYLPRIGQEVMVNFLEGNPDSPIVTGAVFNGVNNTPYALPEHKTRTTLRTQTHQGEGYNELSFDDATNAEEVYLRAQRDLNSDVLNNQTAHIHNDKFLTVDGNQSNEVKKDFIEVIAGTKQTDVHQTFDETVHEDVNSHYMANQTHTVGESLSLSISDDKQEEIGNNSTLQVGGNETLTVDGNRTIDTKGSESLQVGGAYKVNVSGTATINANGATKVVSADSIVLQAGGAQLSLSSSGVIKLTGTSITINGSAKCLVTGGAVSVN
ncbi:type VI secretion system Vgr family protein [Vibrio sp. WXL103]|uniref:type VI secretion system Vgr family protein n=1 Tax=Vibrio sp. WXL103 TaxID=3450710 RepID=UPI003EC736E1